jgi:uncharacterized protein GlcG (DUF336 family)
MSQLTLDQASTIVDTALARGREMSLKPLTIVVLDDGGNLKAFKREDGPGAAMRPGIAIGKAFGAVGMGMASRAIRDNIAIERPFFATALVGVSDGRFVPVPGGVLIRNGDNEIIGAVGVSGDTSDNDSICGVAGIEAAGLTADDG